MGHLYYNQKSKGDGSIYYKDGSNPKPSRIHDFETPDIDYVEEVLHGSAVLICTIDGIGLKRTTSYLEHSTETQT